ncbi:MAG: MBL fold metallo-hydrolase [Planctomycetes bacterium]|nr:MBL fold metallo-hydrolase [Planctomycetota bacterium]
MRQVFAWSVWSCLCGLCLLLAGCTTETAEARWRRIRLDVPPGAIKAIVLGTAARECRASAIDPTGVSRSPASLCLLSPADRSVFLIDPSGSVVRQLAQVAAAGGVPGGLGEAPVDAVLLTHADAEAAAGLAALLELRPAERPLPVYGARAALESMAARAELATSFPAGRIELREVLPGKELLLGTSLRVTPVAAPIDASAGFLAYRVEGAGKALLYLPRCGPLDALSPPLARLLESVDVALLDGTRLDGRDPNPDGLPDAAHPPIGEAVRLLERMSLPALHVRFTHLAPGNPILDPNNRYQKLLRERGLDLAVDGSEYWL